MKPLTEAEQKCLEVLYNYPTITEASQHSGICDRGFRRHIYRAREKGYDTTPGKNFIRDTHSIGKVTTQISYKGDNGVIEKEWIRSHPSAVQIEEFAQRLENRVSGKASAIPAPKFKDTDKSIWLPIGDPHFGMYAWGAETGDDYDVDIAVSVHTKAIEKLLDVEQKVDRIYICSLGDFLHADNRRQMTEKSGHLLDVDGRYWRVVDMATEAMCRCIEYAATKAKEVVVILLDGNHDPHSSGHIARTLASYYRKSPHIRVDTRVTKHRYEEYGNNLIGLVHGDTTKGLSSLPGVMSCDQREAWGRTNNHYWFTGHIHQQKVFEYPSCVVESFNSLTAKDAYAAEYGYRSRRQMTSIVIHKHHGEIERRMVRPEHFA